MIIENMMEYRVELFQGWISDVSSFMFPFVVFAVFTGILLWVVDIRSIRRLLRIWLSQKRQLSLKDAFVGLKA